MNCMKIWKKILLFVLIATLAVTGAFSGGLVSAEKMDFSIRPQDDFYASVNEATLKGHGRETGENWNYFFDLEDKSLASQEELIRKAAAVVGKGEETDVNSAESKLGTLYALAADQKSRDAQGTALYDKMMSSVMKAKSVQAFLDESASLQYHYGFDGVLNMKVLALDENPGQYVAQIGKMNLGVDAEEFRYSDSQEDNRMYFVDYLGKLLVLAGFQKEEAKKKSLEVLDFVKEIANSQGSGEYRMIPVTDVEKLLSNIDFGRYLGKIYQTLPTEISLRETESLKKLNDYLTPYHLDMLKTYVYMMNLQKFSPYMTSDMADAAYEMELSYYGDAEKLESEKMAVKQVASLLKWETGQIYARQNFAKGKKEAVYEMVEEILDEYKVMLREEEWLSKETRERAVKKLDKMQIRIGIPQDITRYLSTVKLTSGADGGSYLSNVMNLRREIYEKEFDAYGCPVDRTVWNVLPQELTACYYPTDNSINIPAAVLEAPYFSLDASRTRNLGALGTIIGHEITHAFDDLGGKYDENGDYVNWWTHEDRKQFQKKANRIVTYYDEYRTPGIMQQDGKQTLGENIADLGAMSCLTRIVESEKLPAEEFFESYANAWASTSDDFTNAIVSGMDEHAADKVRVNAVMGSCELFYKTYDVAYGDGMYKEPEDRVKLW